MTVASKSVPFAHVFGYPIRHSLSPVLHGTWLERYRIEGRYTAYEVSPDDFVSTLGKLARTPGFRGGNVTVPHKEAAFALADEKDEAALAIGAVNTLVMLEDGRISGRNTDAYGFAENLKAADCWASRPEGHAVVLGAGGAARAVVHALITLGFDDIRIVNRTMERAERISREVGQGRTHVIPISQQNEEALDGAALLVNTTTLGMVGQPALEIDLKALPINAIVNDIVYNPLETYLLKMAKARGNPTVDGLGMLLHQAVPGFVAWFDPPETPAVDAELRKRVLAHLGL